MKGTAGMVLLVFALASLLALGLAKSEINDARKKNKIFQDFKPKDCEARWETGERLQGLYTVYPDGKTAIQVYCYHSLTGSGTVIQRRVNGNVSFYQGWNEYKYGFGYDDLTGDYWGGLEAMHLITSSGRYTLRIHLKDWNENHRYMEYSTFAIADESDGYRLSIGGVSGELMDDMAFSNGMKFYTYDKQDSNYCTYGTRVGWWYNECAFALLNGRYKKKGIYAEKGHLEHNYYDGIYWKNWLGYEYSLMYTSMILHHK